LAEFILHTAQQPGPVGWTDGATSACSIRVTSHNQPSQLMHHLIWHSSTKSAVTNSCENNLTQTSIHKRNVAGCATAWSNSMLFNPGLPAKPHSTCIRLNLPEVKSLMWHCAAVAGCRQQDQDCRVDFKRDW